MHVHLHNKKLVLSAILLCAVQAMLLTRFQPSATTVAHESTYHALDVGQGDGTLIELQDGTRILTDAGPDQRIMTSIEKVLGQQAYIDIGVITHLQKDHFYGFVPLLQKYQFGIILWNGRVDAADKKDWNALLAEAEERHIPMLSVSAGDSIRTRTGRIDILSPDVAYKESAEPNDTSVVEHVQTNTWSALITGDIDAILEHDLVQRYGGSLRSDILKVPHHGSAYSSTAEFIRAVSPQIATISVGLHNVYHHPSPDTVTRYKNMSVQVVRTDEHRTINIRDGPSGSVVVY